MLEVGEKAGTTGMFVVMTDYRYTNDKGRAMEVHHAYGPYPDRKTALSVSGKARRQVKSRNYPGETMHPSGVFTTHVAELINEAALNKVPQEWGHNLYRMHAPNAATLDLWVGNIMACDHGHHFSIEKGENNIITSMLGLECSTHGNYDGRARRG